MAEIKQETRYQLAQRELLALEHAEGYLLACTAGEVWITVAGQQEDIILKAGESWPVDDAGAVVVSALQPALLVATHPQAVVPRIATRQMAESILLLLQRWKHRPLARYPSTLLR